MSDPHGFQKFVRVDAPKRPVSERVQDWKDLYRELPEAELKQQGSRCMDCGVPFCQSTTGCPLHNAIPDWNALIADGRWDEALSALHSTNNFPEFTGKLCPAPCESACVLGMEDQPVAIRNIEWNIIERGFSEKRVEPMRPIRLSGKKVAIVGSGPAGLTSAQQLVRLGHEVVVFEKADSIGGLLRYGIPDFKMEKAVLDRRLMQLASEGVVFRTSMELGKEITIDGLREEFDAVALTIGAERPRDLAIPGRDLSGVHLAMDFLTAQNRATANGKEVEGELSARGKKVLIIGSGDTASDCLGTVHRQRCSEVHQLAIMSEPSKSRDESTPWPMWPLQLRSSHAHEEGGVRSWAIDTREFVGDAKGVKLVRGVHVGSGEPVEFAVDMVLIAIGFQGSQTAWADPFTIKINQQGSLVVGKKFQTSTPRVYSSGDATRGASLIVWAIADARKMAASIHADLLLMPERGKSSF